MSYHTKLFICAIINIFIVNFANLVVAQSTSELSTGSLITDGSETISSNDMVPTVLSQEGRAIIFFPNITEEDIGVNVDVLHQDLDLISNEQKLSEGVLGPDHDNLKLSDDVNNFEIFVYEDGKSWKTPCKDIREAELKPGVTYQLGIPRNLSFPKCCPKGYSYELESSEGDTRQCNRLHDNNLKIQLQWTCGNVELSSPIFQPPIETFGDPCQNGKYLLDKGLDQFYLGIDGRVHLFVEGTGIWESYGADKYCLETFEDDEDGTDIVLPLLCFDALNAAGPSKIKLIVYATALLISVPFLLATLAAYILVKELRDVHGKALCCHVACLAIAFFTLACVQLSDGNLGMELCSAVALIIQFSFMACFFWLNVMCCETYLSIRRVHEFSTKKSMEDNLRFIAYSVYAWGGPLLIQAITLGLHFTPVVPGSYAKPILGNTACWFETKSDSFFHFYLPLGILILLNIILFILTAIELKKVSSFNSPCRPRSRYYKTLFRQCIILFLVMGINWFLEVLSWAIGGPVFIWSIFDVFNACQGIIIFGLFVYHKNYRDLIWRELKRRFSRSSSSTDGRELNPLTTTNNKAEVELI